MTILTKEWVAEEREKALWRLLLKNPADFPNDRRSLLVCGECGDIGCGAISLIIDFSENTVIWRDFGYENNYESQVHTEEFKDLGPFEFAAGEYEQKLTSALGKLNHLQ